MVQNLLRAASDYLYRQEIPFYGTQGVSQTDHIGPVHFSIILPYTRRY